MENKQDVFLSFYYLTLRVATLLKVIQFTNSWNPINMKYIRQYIKGTFSKEKVLTGISWEKILISENNSALQSILLAPKDAVYSKTLS